MKKLLTILLVLSLVFSLAACGGDTPEEPAEEPEEGTEEPAEEPAEEADAFPEENITVIVPFGAGGSLDRMTRALQPYWEEELDTKIVVENYDGAATLVGTTHFMTLPKDGYAVYAGTQPYLSASIIGGNAEYDIDDFELINFQMLDPSCITVPADSPHETLDDLISFMQENPGEVKVGTIAGGASHVLIEILAEEFDLEYKLVTYDSGNDYRTALLGGHVDIIASSAQGDTSLGDSVRVLAHAGDERLSAWPDSPTFDELYADDGFNVPALGSGRFLAVDAQMKSDYPERFNTLVETYEAAFNSDEYQQSLEDSGEADISSIKGPEKSTEMLKDVHETMLKYKDIILGE